MSNFDDMLANDHLGMVTNKEFGKSCYNRNSLQTFNVIKTDTYVTVDENTGIPIIDDKPMFNTPKQHLEDGILVDTILNHDDILEIENKTYKIRETKKDGIDGIDIYLKDYIDV